MKASNPKRTFVHESIYDKFVESFVKEAENWTVGDPRKAGIRLGPLVSRQHYNKVKGFENCTYQTATIS